MRSVGGAHFGFSRVSSSIVSTSCGGRALLRKLAALGYCVRDADPSLGVRLAYSSARSGRAISDW